MTNETNQTESEEIQNDDVVATAVRRSVAAIAIVSFIIVCAWALTRKPPEAAIQQTARTVLPEERLAPVMRVPEIRFTDITDAAGVDFVREDGAEGEKLLPETMGGGGAFFDFDGDKDQDLLCINGNNWPWAKVPAESTPISALYANDGTGKFLNVTASSGLNVPMYGNGVACGDFDNDEDVDVFISCLGANHLFRNDGGGKFTDITESAGVGGDQKAWSTSSGWLDYDNDRDLDLFVLNYIEWSRELDQEMDFTLNGKLRAYGRPTDFTGAFPYLYRNDGGARFTDVSEAAGIQIRDPNTNVPLSKALGTTFADVNNDGLLDILVANDTVQNLLFLNQPGGTFLECAATAGTAFDNAGAARGAMGIDAARFRNTDEIGIAIGNFATEMTALYVCQTPGAELPIFRDEAVSNGLGPVTRTDLKFGVLFLDADLDGRLDLFQNNGHLEEDISVVQASQQYEQPPHLIWNCGTEHDCEFVMLSEAETGPDFQKRMVGRGATMADIDGDGDLDLALFSARGRPRLLRNDQTSGHKWLRLRLQGTSSNRDAIGADVTVTLPDGTVLSRTVMPTRSYQSQVELPVTFGLGTVDSVRDVSIRWPDGSTQSVPVNQLNQMIDVVQDTKN